MPPPPHAPRLFSTFPFQAIRGVFGRWPVRSQTPWPLCSGYVRFFFLRAARRATPSCAAALRLGVPSRPPIDNHLKSACIQNVRRWHIYVSHHQLGAHTSTSFPANACHDVFECMSSSTKHSRLRTSCSMVATCHILMHGNHFFKMICSKQTPFALSYGENEWYALTHVQSLG